jgi:hypothetical protein
MPYPKLSMHVLIFPPYPPQILPCLPPIRAAYRVLCHLQQHRAKGDTLLITSHSLRNHAPPLALHLDRFPEDLVLDVQQLPLPIAQLTCPRLNPHPRLSHRHHHLPQPLAVLARFCSIGLREDRLPTPVDRKVMREATEVSRSEDDRRGRLRGDDDWHVEHRGEQSHQRAVFSLRTWIPSASVLVA